MGMESFKKWEAKAEVLKPKTPEIRREAEAEARNIVEERGNLLKRILERVLEAKEALGEKIRKLPPERQGVWGDLKEIPFLQSAIFASEGILKNEPGRVLNTRGVLLKYATAGIALARDLREFSRESKEDTSPQIVKEGKMGRGETASSSKSVFSILSEFLDEEELASSVKPPKHG